MQRQLYLIKSKKFWGMTLIIFRKVEKARTPTHSRQQWSIHASPTHLERGWSLPTAVIWGKLEMWKEWVFTSLNRKRMGTCARRE